MSLKFKSINQSGFDHILGAVFTFVAVGLVGTVMLVISHAYTVHWSGVLEESGASSGYCLSASGSSIGSLVVLNPCSSSSDSSQNWDLNYIKQTSVFGTPNVEEFTLQNLSGKTACLNDPNGSVTSGTALQLNTCSSNNPDNLWVWGGQIKGKGLAYRQLVNVATVSGSNALCLDDANGSHGTGTKVQLWTCKKTGQSNQEWFETSSPKASSSGSGGSGNSAAGSNVTDGCTYGGVVAPCIGNTTSGASGWGKPIFDDEFSNDSSLNTKVWSPDWFGNGSIENNTTMLTSNVNVSGGYLNLIANGTTGGLVSTNPDDGQPGHAGFQFTYGFAEARIYLPGGSNNQIANWPAWWTDGQHWPTDGEDDIIEGLHGEICWHFPTAPGNPGGCDASIMPGWHTFASDWEPGKVTYYYDGADVASISNGITSVPMYLILENSTGSSSGPHVSPATMKVQYVRVWQGK